MASLTEAFIGLLRGVGLDARIETLALELLEINHAQWRLEDAIRMPGCSEAELARIKRRIDSSNAARNAVVQEIDRTVVADWSPVLYDAEGPFARNSESIGRLMDGLSILTIRHAHLHSSGDSARADEALRRRRYMVRVLTDFALALREAAASYCPETDLKSYGAER